jgi:hypothetical protein
MGIHLNGLLLLIVERNPQILTEQRLKALALHFYRCIAFEKFIHQHLIYLWQITII